MLTFALPLAVNGQDFCNLMVACLKYGSIGIFCNPELKNVTTTSSCRKTGNVFIQYTRHLARSEGSRSMAFSL